MLFLDASNVSTSSSSKPIPHGRFLVPEIIVKEFGLQSGMSVADFGSGSGYFTILMAGLVGESGNVNAIDIVEADLEIVRAKATSSGIKNLQTIRANLEIFGASGITSDSQDFVLMANVLFQNDDKVGIIKEAKRVIKSGGRLVIIDWKKGIGGFGPPDNYRILPETAKSLVQQEDFVFEKEINAGSFHFGLIFIRK